MKQEICNKIRQHFSAMSIYKDPASTNSLFAGRNLPAFVKDFLLKRYLNIQTGEIDKLALTQFLDKVIPSQQGIVKDRLQNGEEVTLLARFMVYIDIVKNERQFAIPCLIEKGDIIGNRIAFDNSKLLETYNSISKKYEPV